MCGRFILKSLPEAWQRAFDLEFSITPNLQLRPRYNIAPTQDVPILREVGGRREVVPARWGLIPAWADDPAIGNRMINARAETLATKPAYRAAFRARRCVIPADGFFEWARRPAGGGKQPHLIRRKDGASFGLAGLWELWSDPRTGEVVTSCVVITCTPNALLAALHDRMPVILDATGCGAWLKDGGIERLRPCPDGHLEIPLVPAGLR